MAVAAPAHKWTRQPDKRPHQIMDAALDVFYEHGFQGATMDDIAHAAGVTKGTIYLYFENKVDLFVQTLRAQVDSMMALVPEVSAESLADLEGLAQGLARAALDVLLSPAMVKVTPLFIAEVRRMPELHRAYVGEWLPRVTLRTAEILGKGMEAGLLKPLDPLITARALMGMFSIFLLTQEVFQLKEMTPMRPDDIAETIVTVFFKGVLVNA